MKQEFSYETSMRLAFAGARAAPTAHIGLIRAVATALRRGVGTRRRAGWSARRGRK